MSKYIVQKSTQPNSWVLTDTENGVVIVFEDGRFNETQKVTMLEDAPKLSPTDLAQIMRKLGEWGARHHGSKLFKNVYGFEYSEDDKHLYLYRKNPPRWRMELENGIEDKRKLASTLNKAAEYITKITK
ncbi:DNA breaking-rejoining protein [Prevotella intermedia]|uniref:DNA breaking-rejoining protein n=1 Tax=Prevotella intermedia TaxID=28131 RepID=UPI0021A9E412|nr:DNA breaking-rejoining protein [Prevotella intermedia]